MAHTFSGPGGTEYTAAGAGPLGRVGTAMLDDGRTRVRVEPHDISASAAMSDALAGWQQPTSDNCRFSLVVSDDELEATLATARKAVGEQVQKAGDSLAACATAASDLAARLEALRG